MKELIRETPEYRLFRLIDTNQFVLSVIHKEIPIARYFTDRLDLDFLKKQTFYNRSICEELTEDFIDDYIRIVDCDIAEGRINLTFSSEEVGDSNAILTMIRNYYEKNAVHITRMFGSYILLASYGYTELTAVRASSIPIKYCPLMIQLLKEVSGETSAELIAAMDTQDKDLQSRTLERLINEVVIAGGYFDTNRPLNSCEANVLFGASETISSAFTDGMVDAAVIVSNNLGTIITTNESNTQGAVKRMTGLFYTSPSEKIMNTASEAGIIPVFPYTAHIDQIAGVRHAIDLGFRKIAVTLASSDNIRQAELDQIAQDAGVTIYQFGLCSTGISEDAAIAMKEHADVVWSCASKQVKNYIEPYAIAQVGIKIPVHIMTEKGWDLVKAHLKRMHTAVDLDKVGLSADDNKPIFLNDGEKIKMIRKFETQVCSDCPHPCI